MSLAPIYYPPLSENNEILVTLDYWTETTRLFKEKKYQDSFYMFMDYLNPKLLNGKRPAKFRIPHDSVVIDVEVTDTEIISEVSIVKITKDTARIPLMRICCEQNFNTLTIPQAKIEDDVLKFYFKVEHEMASPQKLYDVFEDLGRQGDKNRAMFIEKFKASPFEEPIVIKYTEKQLEEVWSIFHKELDYFLNQIEEYSKDRRFGSKHAAVGVAITKLEYILQPQGYLKSQFDKYIWSYHDSKEDFDNRLAHVMKFFDELKHANKEDILKDLYNTGNFIPVRYSVNRENIRSRWQKSFETIKTSMEDSNYEFATLEMLESIYRLFSYYSFPKSIIESSTKALKRASGLPWKDSSKVLYSFFCSIMTDPSEIQDTPKKGLLSRLFRK